MTTRVPRPRDAGAPGRPLTPKQRRFVAEYLVDLNATQAAIRCGYSAGTAKQQASRLLTNVDVSTAIAAATQARFAKAQLTAAATLEAIRHQVTGDVRRLFDAQGRLRPISELSAEEAALIAGFEVIIKNAAGGDGHTDTIHKVRLTDRARYVELAAKHFALLTDKLQLTADVTLVERLQRARRRIEGA